MSVIRGGNLPSARRIQNIRIRRRWNIATHHFPWVTTAGFLFATGLLVFVIGMAYRQTEQQIESSDWVIHSRDVLSAISDAGTATKTAAGAANTYYTDGDEANVTAFTAAERNIHEAINRLRRLTIDNPGQHQLAEDFNLQMNQALVFLRDVLDLRRAGKKGPEALAAVTESSKPLSAELSKTYETMLGSENGLLKERSNSEALASRRALRLGLWGGIFALLLMLSVLAVFLRESSVRLRAERELSRSHAHLEERVKDRTEEVGRVNDLLRAENAERIAAEGEIRLLNADLEKRVTERTAQLVTANQEMEAFCYSVSHDLRAPLRHIDGFSKILVEDFGSKMNAEAAHCLNRIRVAIRNMGQLVDDLLNLSRITRTNIASQPVDIREVVNSVLLEMEPDLAGRKISWKIGTLPQVQGDPALLKQVFVNLLANAVKFTRPRETAEIEVSDASANEETAILVRDNGVGFSMKYAEKLFGVFQRLHTSEQFEGTGVGLATVQRIIKRHGGRIWAESTPERGASFYFTIGIATSSAPGTKQLERMVSSS